MADAFSLIQFKDLPTFTGTLSENATLVAVLDNTRTVRIDWDILNSGLIRGSADQPSSPSDLGEQGNLYVGSTGLYSYSDGSWGKSPRYTENWDDLVPGVRFLRVDGSQSLSSTEQDNVLANVGLTIASAGSAGLVKAWGDDTSELTGGAPVIINPDGTQYVAEATATSLGVVNLTDVATRTYVNDKIAESIVSEELPIASTEVAGVVLSDAPLENGDGVFTVGENGKVTIRPASLYILEETEEGNEVGTGGLPGIYSVTDADDAQSSLYAPTLRLVKELLDEAGELNEVPVATTAYVGGVKAWLDNAAPADYAAKVIINASGLQYVPTATSGISGVVRVADVVTTTSVYSPASAFTVPTVSAVYTFVSANFPKLDEDGKVSDSALPLATDSTVGAIKGSSTVNIDSYGTASVPDAAVNSKGVVMLAEVDDDTGEFVANTGVTTAAQVKEYVTSKIIAGELPEAYVSKATYDSYVVNTNANIASLWETDEDLRQDITDAGTRLDALPETYVSKETYDSYVVNTNGNIASLRQEDLSLRVSITGVGNSLNTLSGRVGTVESAVSALQQSQGSEVLLNVDSSTVTAVTGWVKYTGPENSTVTFTGVAPTEYVSTLTFQTEVPVTFGGTILWDKGETPSLLAGTGYVFQITSFPGSNVKLGRKVMEYTPQSNA